MHVMMGKGGVNAVAGGLFVVGGLYGWGTTVNKVDLGVH
jgi:hypothetical protein